MKSPRFSASPSTRAILLSVVVLTLTVVDQAGVFSMYANPQAQRTQTAPASSGKENRNKLEETKGLAGQLNSESLTKHSEPGATRTLPAHLDNKPAPPQDQPQEAKKAEATDAPLPSGITALPNLTPFQPSGWSNKIVVSTVPGTHNDSGSLSPSDTLYVDWAVLNTGDATTVRFYTKLYVDGVEKGNWFTDPPLNTNFYSFVEDFSIGSLSAGTHTLRIVADALSNIAESNEFDNEYTRTINITASLPNLTPFQPTGWSNKIVVSTVPGTHSDSGSLSPSDTLYIDWAVSNTGSTATTVRFYTKLYVDGVEKGNWLTDPPLNPNFVSFVEDFSIGRLNAGAHTLRIVTDVLSNIAESNEFDNEYTRTINVTQVPCATLTINLSPSDSGTISRTAENCSTSLDLLPEPDVTLQSVSERPTNLASPNGLSRSAETTERFRTLISKAETDGSVLVIIELRASFQPEGTLSSQAIHSQHNAIVQAQEGLLSQMRAFNLRNIKKFKTIPFVAFEVDAAGLNFLENSPDVISIGEDKLIPPALDQSVSLIGGTNAWAAGYAGAGQTVVILDTGVDKNHSFLAGKVVSETCYSTTSSITSSVCPGGVAQSTSPGSGINCSLPGCEHGTHVAGIAAGKGSSSSGVTFSGVARDANIIAIQVFTRVNSQMICDKEPAPCIRTATSDQMHGLERVLELAGSFNIAAVNMSLGGDKEFTSYCDSADTNTVALKELIDNLRSLKIATVIAAGNSGFINGLSSPACISKAISVGSTGDNSAGDDCPFWLQDRVSTFSNSAPFLNLLAPGQCIRSSIPGGGFKNLAGTSMAAPHVVGAWAVLKSKFPLATVDQILSALTSTGVPITDSRNNSVTRRIQVDAALNALGGSGGDTVLHYISGNTVTLTANANSGFAFVKWQRDGLDYSNSPTINVQVDSPHTMTAVFVIGNSTTINNITLPSGKLVIIDGRGFGSFPSVIINDVDRSNYIIGASDTSITLKGKRKKMGLRVGNNTVRVIGTNGASNVYIVPIF